MKLAYIKHQLGYNSWQMTLLGALHTAGFLIQPYDLFLEGRLAGPIPVYETPPDGFRIQRLGPADMDGIIGLPDRNIPKQNILARFQKEIECLAVFRGEELLAFTWCNLAENTFPGDRFPLGPDEAYLFDAYTCPQHRGKGLAPLVRYQIYKKLEQMGRHRFYSVSLRLNKRAIRFKLKLHARILRSGIYVELFRRWRYTQRLAKKL
jgi:GNAT superfamily N-acetyltransferase